MALASSMACSSSRNGVMQSTGPKISSWKIRMSGVTSAKTGGPHEEALVEPIRTPEPAGDQPRALVAADLDVAAHRVELLAAGHGAHEGRPVARVAYRHGIGRPGRHSTASS